MSGQTITNVYCFSGLGADERAFAKMKLPEGFNPVFIKWIRPHRNEPVAEYALRIGRQIDTTAPYSFIGLSFGGMIALELTKTFQPEQIILISSFTEPQSASGVIRFLGRTGLYHIFPFGLVTIPNRLAYKAFGAEKKETKKMLADILHDTSVSFFRWAVGQMYHWQGVPLPKNLIHIHGDMDRIIPLKITHADVVIPGGGHLMIYEHADEVNRILAMKLH